MFNQGCFQTSKVAAEHKQKNIALYAHLLCMIHTLNCQFIRWALLKSNAALYNSPKSNFH